MKTAIVISFVATILVLGSITEHGKPHYWLRQLVNIVGAAIIAALFIVMQPIEAFVLSAIVAIIGILVKKGVSKNIVIATLVIAMVSVTLTSVTENKASASTSPTLSSTSLVPGPIYTVEQVAYMNWLYSNVYGPAFSVPLPPACPLAPNATKSEPYPFLMPNYYVPPAVYSAAAYRACVAYLNFGYPVKVYWQGLHIQLPNVRMMMQFLIIISSIPVATRNLYIGSFFWPEYLKYRYTQDYFWAVVRLYGELFKGMFVGDVGTVCAVLSVPIDAFLALLTTPACTVAADIIIG